MILPTVIGHEQRGKVIKKALEAHKIVSAIIEEMSVN